MVRLLGVGSPEQVEKGEQLLTRIVAMLSKMFWLRSLICLPAAILLQYVIHTRTDLVADVSSVGAFVGAIGTLYSVLAGFTVITVWQQFIDTDRAVKHGMSGVIVSNHGARQLDQVGSTIKALPECVQAASGKIPVLVDGGFRRGTDVFKALALGAAAVGIGRPYLWGLASFGQRGVEQVMKILQAELATDMGMAGTGKVSEIDRSYVRILRQ